MMQIVDFGAKTGVFKMIDDSQKSDALEELFRQYGIKELVRTEKIALPRRTK